MNANRSDSVVSELALVPLIGLAPLVLLLLYWPGLGGPFLLDDVQLHTLHWIHFPIDLEVIRGYLAQGETGPTGRPVAMLSFLIDGQRWPAGPWQFKLTNLQLHLVNTLLVQLLALKLGLIRGLSMRHAAIASLAAGVAWGVAPINVSTTLYVIQRMALLSTLFALAALLLYLYGRPLLQRGRPLALFSVTIGVASFGSLSLLSKENGVVLLLLIPLVELTLLPAPRHRMLKLWLVAVCLLPLLIVVGYLLMSANRWLAEYTYRDFSFSERLLTQARAVIDYLSQILLPNRQGMGPFQDDYPISSTLVDPPETLLALLLLALLVGSVALLWRRWPIWSFAIGWFFAAHLLESSVLPLELYFEHRNYLPAVGLALGFGFLIIALLRRGRLWLLLGLVWLTLNMTVTYQRTTLWGDHRLATPLWAAEHPASERAQLAALERAIKLADRPQVAVHLQALQRHHASDPEIELVLLRSLCRLGNRYPGDLSALAERLEGAALSKDLLGQIAQISSDPDYPGCPRFGLNERAALVEQLIANPNYRSALPRGRLQSMRFELAVRRGDLNTAMNALEAAFEASGWSYYRLKQAQLLIDAGLHEAAAEYLNRARGLTRSLKEPHITPDSALAIRNLELEIERLRSAAQDSE